MKKIRVRAPRGFYFKIRTEVYKGQVVHVNVELFDKKAKYSKYSIGEVEPEQLRPKRFVTHSNLRSEYWGKKLGVLMYAKAIAWCLNRGYSVSSSGSSSEMATRVWEGKSLRNLFDIKKRSWSTWFAYPKSRKRRKK